MRAIDIGRTHVITAPPHTPVRDIAQMMLVHQVSCITIVDAREVPLGVICEHDLVTHTLSSDTQEQPLCAIKVMSQPAVVCRADASLAAIVQAMENGSVAHLPLVNDHHQLVGIVSATDVTAAVAELLARLARALAPDALSDRPYG